MYGLDIFFDTAVGGSTAREFYKNRDDLSSIKDSVLLTACTKLELISDTTYKKLKHILDMRNDIGISHPNDYTINAYELLGYLQNCISDVLNDKPTEAALQVKQFVENIKVRSDQIDAQQSKAIQEGIAKLPSRTCGGLLRNLFGMYVSTDSSPVVRKNISLIAPSIWNSCQDEPKYKLGILLEGYNVNLHQEKYALGGQFFDFVGGNAYRSPSERVIIVDELITELVQAHEGWDNFHNEGPVAAKLYSFVPDQNAIFDNLAGRFFKTLLMCRIGRGVSYNQGISPSGRIYYDSMLSLAGDKYAAHAMAALSSFEIRQKLSKPICRPHAIDALRIMRGSVINERLLECLDYLINNIDKDYGVVMDKTFKDLTKGYINWN
jgi:hypothetical protein